MYRILFVILWLLLSTSLFADIQSTSGNIIFDTNDDGQSEATINSTGLMVGTGTASSNLEVSGNMVIENGNIGIGTTGTNSSLEISGTFGINTELVSNNTTLSSNSIVLADSSSDNILLTLPYAGNVTGRTYSIKKVTNSNSIWITGGGNAIDDLGSLELTSSANALPTVTTVSDGLQWYILEMSEGVGIIGSSNLVGWWKLDESNGTSASDSSALNHTGTLTNGISFSGCSFSGPISKSLSFDGSDDYISVPTALSTLHGDVSTVAAWVKIIAYDGNGCILFSTNTGSIVYWQVANDGQVYVMNNVITVSPNIDFDDGNWHHIAFTSDGTTSKLYWDGTERESDTDSVTSIANGNKNFAIGDYMAGLGSNWTFNGNLDDFRVYNRALNSTEIQALYMNGN